MASRWIAETAAAPTLDGIRAIYFDAVGTLLYPCPPVAAAYARIGARYGVTLDEAEIDRRFRAAFADEEVHDRTVDWRTDEARERGRWQAIIEAVFHDQPDPRGPVGELWNYFASPVAWACFQDVASTLERLLALDWPLGIASNFDARLRGVVAGFPALAPCQHLAISSELGWRKPAPAFFAALCRQAGLAPGELLLIGDDLGNDVTAARAAGLQAMLLNRRATDANPDTLTSLAALVERLPPTRAQGITHERHR